MPTPKLYIYLKPSKRPKHYRYVMYGDNTEHMMESELIENITYLKKLMKRFAAMGFIIVNKTKLKIS